MLAEDTFHPDNGDGWRLDVTRYHDPDALDRSRAPVLMVPGYGMNTFILNFHPTGDSMVAYLCHRGFEVFTANLRGQGGSTCRGDGHRYGFRELSLIDYPTVQRLVLEETLTEADRLHGVGCSLGASILYAYLAHHLDSHRFASLIAIGGPLRWIEIHPAVKTAFGSPKLAAMLRIRGTRKLARTFLPMLKKAPWLLSIYMNVDQIDLSEVDKLVKTVDDPNPYLNVQIARWLDKRDLVVAGLNVTDALRGFDQVPILCLLASDDGIVPASSAKSVRDIVDPKCVDVVEVGTEKKWYAHADLFISEEADRTVFEPMAEWLDERL